VDGLHKNGVVAGMCSFDDETKRCRRCGFQATELPFYRACMTLAETAEFIAHDMMDRRISVPPLLVGTAISSTLARVGITPAAIKKITGKDCGCKQRASKLDAAGAAVSAVVERAANAALQVILPSHVEPSDVAAIANNLQASPLTNPGLKSSPSA